MEISEKSEIDDENKPKKLIFSGLDNSGKTSIATVLTENMANLSLIKPTYFVKRDLLKYMNYEIIEHDMGGQRNYILQYFKNPERYFGETDVCVFVVDIQDGKRISESMKYFKDLLMVFSNLTIKPAIYLFLHKAERILSNISNEDETNMIKVKELASDINDSRFKLDYCLTSIFEPFSILRGFGQIVRDLYPIGDVLQGVMQGLAERLNAQIVVLMDDHLIPIIGNFEEKESEDLVNHSAMNIYFLKQSLDTLKDNPSKSLYIVWEGIGLTLVKLPPAVVSMYMLVIGSTEMMEIAKIDKEINEVSEEIFRALNIML